MSYRCSYNLRRPEAINTIVKNVIAAIDKDCREIDEAWRKAVNVRLRRHTKPVGIQRGTLVVNVDNPGWLYLLSLDKERLLKTIRANIKDIKEIRLRIGEI